MGLSCGSACTEYAAFAVRDFSAIGDFVSIRCRSVLSRLRFNGCGLPVRGHCLPVGTARRRDILCRFAYIGPVISARAAGRSEEHTSELQSLMRISYAVFCLKKNITMAKNRH